MVVLIADAGVGQIKSGGGAAKDQGAARNIAKQTTVSDTFIHKGISATSESIALRKDF